MPQDFRWGGIDFKKMCKEVFRNFWMIPAVMVTAFLGISLLDHFTFSPMYTSRAVVAVYPFDNLYTLDIATDSMDAVNSVNSVLNSDMFLIDLEKEMGKLKERSFYSSPISNTNMLVLEARSPTPADAYLTLRHVLKSYRKYAGQLPGNSTLEVLSRPEIPFKATNESKILRYRLLLTLFAGFSMGCLLLLLYIGRSTCKTAGAVRRQYKEARFYTLPPSGNGRKKGGRAKVDRRMKAMALTAMELFQLTRALGARTLFFTSAARKEGKTDLVLDLAGELSAMGRRITVVEGDMKHPAMLSLAEEAENTPEGALQDVLQGKTGISESVFHYEEKDCMILPARQESFQDDYTFTATEASALLRALEKETDLILIDGGTWDHSGEAGIWLEAADASFAVFAPDRASFEKGDRLMEDLEKGRKPFAGVILNGFG